MSSGLYTTQTTATLSMQVGQSAAPNANSLDALVNAATRAGLQVDLRVTTRERTAERAVANA